MNTDAPLWVEVLDAMERRLAVAGRTLAGEGDVRVDHFTLPPGLGPLPSELVARARELLRATSEAEALVGARVADLAEQLRRTTAASRPAGLAGPGSERPVPRYFDRTA